MTKREIIRDYYSGWERKLWSAVERLLADSFTFTSPNGDNHIDKRAFKTKCWPEADWVERIELESVIGRDARYLSNIFAGPKTANRFGI